MTRVPWPFLPLVQEPVATDAAEELAGIDRLRELLVDGDWRGVHVGEVSPQPDAGMGGSWPTARKTGRIPGHGQGCMIPFAPMAMVNPFVDSLDRLTIQQVKELLGLGGAPEAAMREGFRVDFKGVNPKTGELDQDAKGSLCKATAAFSNTAGGLVFVGVREENHFAREIIGVPRRGELKTKLDSVIRSGVIPAPLFTIGAAVVDETQGKERDMAVIRVEQGTWPPYCYSESGTQTVVIRSNDKSIPPTLLELDALYEKRARGLQGWKPGPVPTEPSFGIIPSARLVFQPMQPISVLLHRGTEESLKDAYFERFCVFGEKAIGFSRSADYSELTSEQFGTRRKWRGFGDGNVVFATELLRRTSGETSQPEVMAVHLVDLAADLVGACRAAQMLFERVAPVARVNVTLELRLAREKVFNLTSFDDRGRLTLDESSLDPKHWQADVASAAEQVDETELADPDDLVGRLLTRVLRATRGADIHLERFSKSITNETR